MAAMLFLDSAIWESCEGEMFNKIEPSQRRNVMTIMNFELKASVKNGLLPKSFAARILI